jgi:hypothetical protein
MFVALRFPQLLELLRPEHFAQSVGRIHGAVDHDMYDVDSFRCELYCAARTIALTRCSPSASGTAFWHVDIKIISDPGR